MNEQDYILFEDYLNKSLSEAATLEFETRLKTDTVFSEAFKIYKETVLFLEHKFENETQQKAFKANLQHISETHFNKAEETKVYQRTPRNLPYFKLALAASIVVLFGIFVFNFYAQPEYSDYAHYGTISLTVRGNNEALLQTAQNAFNSKDFAKANEAFSSLILLDQSNDEFKLYGGISKIELNHFTEAESLLSQVVSGTSVYKHKATWYMALSLLKQEEFDACVGLLKSIPKDAEDYKSAQSLINKLD